MLSKATNLYQYNDIEVVKGKIKQVASSEHAARKI